MPELFTWLFLNWSSRQIQVPPKYRMPFQGEETSIKNANKVKNYDKF